MSRATRAAASTSSCATGRGSGPASSASCPSIVAGSAATAAFVVTDPGSSRSGVAGRVVDLARAARPRGRGLRRRRAEPGHGVDRARERAHSATSRPTGDRDGRRRAWRRLGDGFREGRSRSTPANQRAVMSLGYHDETVAARAAGRRRSRRPPGTGAETNTYGVITDESIGRKGYVGHESVLPRARDPRSRS